MGEDLFEMYANLPIDSEELKEFLKGKTTPKDIAAALEWTDFDKKDPEIIADALEAVGYPFNTIAGVLTIRSNQSLELAKLFDSVSINH